MFEITETSTKNQIISNIVESGLHDESKSVLQKNYTKAQLLELLTALNENRKTVAQQAKQDALAGKQINILDLVNDEVVEGSDESITAEDMLASMKADEEVPVVKKAKRRPTKSAKTESEPVAKKEKTAKKPTSMHLVSETAIAPMKTVRGIMRSKVEKAATQEKPIDFTLYTGSIDKPGLTLNIKAEVKDTVTIDPSGNELIMKSPVYIIDGEEFAKTSAYQAVRTFFNL